MNDVEREMKTQNEAAHITLHETAKKVRLTELIRERKYTQVENKQKERKLIERTKQ